MRDSKQVLTELLVYKAQGGDQQAFADLYELWSRDFLRLARYASRSSAASEEIVQDTWISIAKSIRSLEDPARFRAWAFRVLYRRSTDWIRWKQTERERATVLAEIEDRAESAVRGSRASVALGEAIQELDTDSRTLVHLFYEVGLSVSELAESLEIPPGTVKSRLFALRTKLKSELERKML